MLYFRCGHQNGCSGWVGAVKGVREVQGGGSGRVGGWWSHEDRPPLECVCVEEQNCGERDLPGQREWQVEVTAGFEYGSLWRPIWAAACQCAKRQFDGCSSARLVTAPNTPYAQQRRLESQMTGCSSVSPAASRRCVGCPSWTDWFVRDWSRGRKQAAVPCRR